MDQAKLNYDDEVDSETIFVKTDCTSREPLEDEKQDPIFLKPGVKLDRRVYSALVADLDVAPLDDTGSVELTDPPPSADESLDNGGSEETGDGDGDDEPAEDDPDTLGEGDDCTALDSCVIDNLIDDTMCTCTSAGSIATVPAYGSAPACPTQTRSTS